MTTGSTAYFRPVIDRSTCEERLKLIFPPAAFDTVLSNRLAASSVAAMIYVGAVIADDGETSPENVWARPQTVLSMSDETLERTTDHERGAWAAAAAIGVSSVTTLLSDWGVEHHRWYATDTRETLRDETWPKWLKHGAVRRREGIAQTSSQPRWALTASFAGLFDPSLTDPVLIEAIDEWRDEHMAPGDLLRIQHANELARSEHYTPVLIPGYGTRNLEPGVASAIIKGVIEEWAPQRLANPLVVAISEPGEKAWIIDSAKMAAAGISINVSNLLPDAIVLDVGVKPPIFWIIEAVATDGEINDSRKEQLLAWAQNQYIDPTHCQFLSAFSSRNSAPARRRLKDIATGTYCWFLDEPAHELAWYELG